jgi:hypothetical protein
VQFDGFHAINNFNGLVWTETKNMQVPTRGPHIRNSVFEWIDSYDDSGKANKESDLGEMGLKQRRRSSLQHFLMLGKLNY